MKVLVTAGATNVPIDRVRMISNIFKGTTGAKIAEYFSTKNDDVTLLTSNKNNIFGDVTYELYNSFDDLKNQMETLITTGNFDVIIHSAAVSDYKVNGVFHQSHTGLVPIDNSKKISSEYPDIFLKLSPTPKLVDFIRKPWGFSGTLVKFKLQVGISDKELLDIAKKSREDSNANYIVANCLEWAHEYAYIVGKNNQELNVSRNNLPEMLYNVINGVML